MEARDLYALSGHRSRLSLYASIRRWRQPVSLITLLREHKQDSSSRFNSLLGIAKGRVCSRLGVAKKYNRIATVLAGTRLEFSYRLGSLISDDATTRHRCGAEPKLDEPTVVRK